jgi:hypothetical protein
VNIPDDMWGRVNINTKIVNAYLDFDLKEFVSKEELIKRYPNPYDYYLQNHTYDKHSNEHRILWSYSKKFFTVNEAVKASRKLSNKE